MGSRHVCLASQPVGSCEVCRGRPRPTVAGVEVEVVYLGRTWARVRFVHGPKRGETRKVSAKDIVWPTEEEPGQVGLGLDVDNDPEVLREHEADFTPQGLVVDLLTYLDGLLVEPPRIAVDPCTGPGAWGQVEAELWPDSFRVGVELRRSETGGGHYQRFVNGVGIDDALAGKAVGGRFHEDLLAADAVITNPAFKPTFERGDGRGKARVPRPCWIETFLERFRSLRVMALLGRTQFGQRGDGVGILADYPPLLQLRATAAAACRGGSGVDSSDYSLWVWGVPTAFRCSTSFGSWRTFNVPARSICGAIYRWENGRPGDGPLSPGLLQTIGAARRLREERAR